MLTQIVHHLDRLLRTSQFQDWEGACNGLQVENSGRITRIAAAVDASLATVREAARAKAGLLIVHHGLFWHRSHPWTASRFAMIRLLIENNLAVYSSHLPLDAHPQLGNNILLAKALRLRSLKPFFTTKGREIGFRGRTRDSRDQIRTRLAAVLQRPVHLLPGGSPTCREVGVVTGGAGAELAAAAAAGVDTFITGEGPHWTYARAEELELNVFYGGHYATETFGVKALAQHLSAKYRVPWTFIDHPSGL